MTKNKKTKKIRKRKGGGGMLLSSEPEFALLSTNTMV